MGTERIRFPFHNKTKITMTKKMRMTLYIQMNQIYKYK